MHDDAAIRFFIEDAKRQGLSEREYERRYGILLRAGQQRIAAHETPISAIEGGWESSAIREVGATLDDETTAGIIPTVVVVSEEESAA